MLPTLEVAKVVSVPIAMLARLRENTEVRGPLYRIEIAGASLGVPARSQDSANKKANGEPLALGFWWRR